MKNAYREIDTGKPVEETAFIDRFVADYCRPHNVVEAERLAAFVAERPMSFMRFGMSDFALAAGPADVPPGVQSPDEEVTFTFASDGAPDAPGAWKASLTVPPKAGPETMVTLSVVNSSDEPFDAGVFKLSGVALPLTGGCAEIPFGMFLAGIKDADVSFCRPGEEPVGGTLAFFC